jgi:hypothetical protein
MKSTKVTITEIAPKSVALVSAVVLAVIGAFAGLITYVTYLVIKIPENKIGISDSGDAVSSSSASIEPFPYPMLIVLPALYGLFGYFVGYAACVIYNFLAPKIGGIKISAKTD